MPVCSKPAGNTKFKGLPADKQLCDMAENVWQWVQDKYRSSYKDAPIDGSTFDGGGGYFRVVRGSSFHSFGARYLQAGKRSRNDPVNFANDIGFRLAR